MLLPKIKFVHHMCEVLDSRLFTSDMALLGILVFIFYYFNQICLPPPQFNYRASKP